MTSPISSRSEFAVSAPLSGGCPPPLQWQEVVTTYREQVEAWFLDRPGYQLRGSMIGQGPPLYLLPGFGGTTDLYALLAWLLRDSFRCVLVDYPGGVTGAIPRFTARSLAEDLRAAADKCGDERFALFGSGFGGLIALQAALDFPERISHVLLQGAFAHRQLAWAERCLARVFTWLPGRLKRVPGRKAIQQQNHQAWFPPYDMSRFEFFVANTGEVRLAALARRAAIVRDTDLRPSLPRIQVPTLLIQGEGEGRLSEQALSELQQGLPHARLERMHTTGQIPYLTHPHRIAQLVRQFVAQPSPA